MLRKQNLLKRYRLAFITSLFTIYASVMPNFAMAGAAEWSSTNFQYLYGDNYQRIAFDPDEGKLIGVDDANSVITLEHVNGWKYGDNFFFVDITNADSNDTQTPTSFYAEISPRLSFSKIFNSDLSHGLIKDVLLTSTAEIGQGFHNYLYGVAVDLNIPNVPVFQINYYVRNEITAATDTGYQVTLVWLYPFSTGPIDWTFEGFFDYAWDLGNDEADTKDNIISGPRLLMDVGKFWGAEGTLQFGIEHQIWRNKFGIDDVDEDATQLMVKWIW